MKPFAKLGLCFALIGTSIGFGPSAATPVSAASLIANGTFEGGSLTNWTVYTTSGTAPSAAANLSADEFNEKGSYFLASGVAKDRWTIAGNTLNLNQMIEDGDMYVQNKSQAASADMEVSAKINIADGGAAAGLKIRSDDRNMMSYAVILYPGSDELALVKFPYTGTGSVLHKESVTLNTNTDYTLKAQSYAQSGNVVTKVYLGGTLKFTYTDTNDPTNEFYFQPSGKYAGVTANTTKATFDDFTLSNFPGGSSGTNVVTDNFSSSTLSANYQLFASNKTIVDDGFKGLIASDNFTIDKNYLSFRMGGQKDETNEYVALVRNSDNVILYKNTGENADHMSVKTWDVSAYQNVSVHIAIVDSSAGSRSHIVADDFTLANAIPMEKDVSILESQVGYHTNGVKRIYLRSAKANPDVNPAGRTFSLKSGTTSLMTGTVSAATEKWGSYWWTIDFSAYTTPGTNLHVELDDLVSSDFDIGDNVLTDNNQLVKIALDQLEARAVPGKLGWLDSSGDIRELTSMIIATNALVDIREQFNAQLSSANQTRLDKLIQDGADYLVAAQNTDGRTDGRFVHDLYPNPWGGYEVLSLHDAIFAMTALARAYQVTADADHLNAAEKAYAMIQARKASNVYNPVSEMDYHGDGNGLTFTSRSARIEYYIPDSSWTMPTSMKTKEKMTYLWANTLMYRITNDNDYKNTAIEMADSIAERQLTDFDDPVDGAYGNFYEFEGYDGAFVKDWVQAYSILLGYIEPTNLKGFIDLIGIDPGNANVAKWYNVVRTYGENYLKKTAADNPLGIYPVAAYADPAYRGVKYFQSIAHGATSLYGMIAKNMLEIGNFLNDSAYQKLAENNLQFVVGLNPGFPNSTEETAWDSRSLLKNIGKKSFQGFGGLKEAPDGSGFNGFSAVDQFVQKDIRLAQDAPEGILRPNGLLQFNEDYIPHGLGYASGLAFLEGPYQLKIVTKNNGAPVSASINVQLATSHAATTNAGTGAALVTNLPLGQSGTVSVTYGSTTIQRPISVIGGGSMTWNVDFYDYVDVAVTTPPSLATGQAKEATVSLHNYGSNSVTGMLNLIADGATLSSGASSVTVGGGSTATRTFDVVAGVKTTPYLVYARFVSGHNDSTAIGYGNVQGSASQLLSDDFADNDLAGWDRSFAGTWSASSGKGAVNTSGASDAYALFRGPGAKSFVYEGDLVIGSQAGNHGAAGLTFWSNADGTKRYDLVIDKGDNTIKVLKRPYAIVQYATVSGGLNYGQMYHARVKVTGTSAAIYLDNMSTPVFTTTLPDFAADDADNPCSDCNRFGLFGYDDGAIQFDNVSATLARPVTGVTLNKSLFDLAKGFKETLRASIAPSDAANRLVTWTTSNAAVATVANGVVTGLKEGTAVVTATTADGSYSASAVVRVKLINENFSTDEFFMNAWSIYGGAWYDVPADGGIEVSAPADFAYSISNMAKAADFTYSAKIKLKSGSSAGLSFRMDDLGTKGYDVTIDTAGNIQLAARPYAGAIATASYAYSSSAWYELKVVAEQSRIQVYLNGVQKIDVATDTQFSSGRFGLMAFLSTADFDSVVATQTLLDDNFDDGDQSGWTASGTWTNGSGAIQFATGTNNTATLTNGTANAANFVYEGDVTMASGDASLAFRLNGAGTQGYDLILSPGGDLVKLAERPYALLASQPYTLNANQTYHLKIAVSGRHVQAYIDGTLVLNSYSATTYQAGRFGLLAFNGSGYFDNFKAAFLETASGYADTFTDTAMTGWRAVGGTWTNASTYRQGVATTAGGEDVYDDAVLEDLSVSADVTIASGGNAAGLDFRLNDDATRGYSVILDRLDSGGILKLATKPYSVLGAYYLPLSTGVAYNVRVEAVGSRIKVYLNNVLRIDVVDSRYSRGKIGLFAYNGTAQFDNLSATAIN